MNELKILPAHLIGPRAGSPPIDEKKVASLAESIKEVGLISPIVVTPGKRMRNGLEVDGWDIIAGRHRFKAMNSVLNWGDIPCLVYESDDLRLELVTIDENLQRNVMSEAERARQLARRKEIYEALHPETKLGANNQYKSARRQNGDEQTERFTKEAAKLTGKSERTIQRDVARAEALGPDLELIAGTSLDKGIEIDALASLPPEERRPIIEKAAKGEVVSARTPRPFKVAADPLGDVEASEKQVARLMDAWNAAGPEARSEFLLRIDQPIMDRRYA